MPPFLKTTMALTVVCSAANLCAQIPSSPYEIGIRAGLFIYQGDLTPAPAGSFRTPSFVFGLNAARRLNDVLAVRIDLNRGGLRGSDAAYSEPAWRKQRNFKFRSPVTEVTASMVWNPWGSLHKLSPYVFAGVGISFLHINRDASGFNTEAFSGENLNARLAQDVAHPLPRALPIVPAGVGLRYPLASHIFLNAEASYRFMYTDYLDGYSQSANPARNDHYYQYSIGATYAFGQRNRLSCPVVKP